MKPFVVASFISILLSGCATTPSSNGPPPAWREALTGDVAGLQAALDAGASPDKTDSNGNAPLHLAAASTFTFPAGTVAGAGTQSQPLSKEEKRRQLIELLINAGADPNIRHPRLGHTPLHSANDKAGAQALIAGGADVSAVDSKGNTPLHVAGTAAAAQVLLEHGADTAAKNNAGQTPAERLAAQRVTIVNKPVPRHVRGMTDAQWKKQHIERLNAVIAVVNDGKVPDMPEATANQYAAEQAADDGRLLSHLVIKDNSGEYMSPWTSDGVLTEWVDKAINAKMGAAAGSAVGAYAGQKALEQVPVLGGMLGSKLGDAAGRKLAVEAAGGDAYIRRTSDRSFSSLNAMARYLKANFRDDPHFQDAIQAADEIYPGLQQAVAAAR